MVTSVLDGFVRSRLSAFLSAGQIGALLQTSAVVNTFSSEQQEKIRATFGQGYNIQMRILIGLAAAQLPSSLLMWQKKQIIV